MEFEDEALKAIAHQAVERKTGARGLRAILEAALMDTMFELPGAVDQVHCVVTKDVVEKAAKPVLRKQPKALPTAKTKPAARAKSQQSDAS